MKAKTLLTVAIVLLMVAVMLASFASAQGPVLQAAAVTTAPTVDGSESDAA